MVWEYFVWEFVLLEVSHAVVMMTWAVSGTVPRSFALYSSHREPISTVASWPLLGSSDISDRESGRGVLHATVYHEKRNAQSTSSSQQRAYEVLWYVTVVPSYLHPSPRHPNGGHGRCPALAKTSTGSTCHLLDQGKVTGTEDLTAVLDCGVWRCDAGEPNFQGSEDGP